MIYQYIVGRAAAPVNRESPDPAEEAAVAPSLTDAVYEELRRSLFCGRLKAGQVLRLRPLADRLGTSVQPVRDAMQRLVAEGALEAALNRDIRVRSLSRESLVEIYRIRLLLEGEATAMAAATGEADLAGLEAAIAAMVGASADADTAAYSEANFDFHFRIYSAARSTHLMPLIETLWLKVGPMLDIGAEGRTRAETRMFEGQDAHRGLLSALRRRDPVAARARLEEDLCRARDWFLAHQSFPEGDRPAAVRPLGTPDDRAISSRRIGG